MMGFYVKNTNAVAINWIDAIEPIPQSCNYFSFTKANKLCAIAYWQYFTHIQCLIDLVSHSFFACKRFWHHCAILCSGCADIAAAVCHFHCILHRIIIKYDLYLKKKDNPNDLATIDFNDAIYVPDRLYFCMVRLFSLI